MDMLYGVLYVRLDGGPFVCPEIDVLRAGKSFVQSDGSDGLWVLPPGPYEVVFTQAPGNGVNLRRSMATIPAIVKEGKQTNIILTLKQVEEISPGTTTNSLIEEVERRAVEEKNYD